MTTHPYPANTSWSFRSRLNGFEHLAPLALTWEVAGSALSDEYTPDEISAEDLWTLWFPQFGRGDEAKIYWGITGNNVAEFAPRIVGSSGSEDFLTHFTWPVDPATGDRINWLRLPVRDKLWDASHRDKGGFIQQLTGWKPSPFEQVFRAESLIQLVGLQ